MPGYARGELEGRRIESLTGVGTRIFYQTHFFPLVRLHGRAEEVFLLLKDHDGAEVGVLANAARRERGARGPTTACSCACRSAASSRTSCCAPAATPSRRRPWPSRARASWTTPTPCWRRRRWSWSFSTSRCRSRRSRWRRRPGRCARKSLSHHLDPSICHSEGAPTPNSADPRQLARDRGIYCRLLGTFRTAGCSRRPPAVLCDSWTPRLQRGLPHPPSRQPTVDSSALRPAAREDGFTWPGLGMTDAVSSSMVGVAANDSG